jgi:hypothetical protein
MPPAAVYAAFYLQGYSVFRDSQVKLPAARRVKPVLGYDRYTQLLAEQLGVVAGIGFRLG